MILVLSTICFFQVNAQNNFWQDVQESSFIANETQKKLIKPSNFRAVKLNTSALLLALQSAPMEFTASAQTSPLVLTLPLPDGTFGRFAIVQSPMMEPGLQAKFPSIRTYSGQGLDDPSATLVMDWTEFGFHAQVRAAANSFYIDPYAQGETTQYMVYTKKDLPVKSHMEEGVIEQQMESIGGLAQRVNAGVCSGGTLRTYRLAVACTGEYAVAVGASTVAQALSAIMTTVARVNGIYETEVTVRLSLVSNNNLIVFTNATTDPFNGNNNASTLINESQTVIDANIFSANYDIGHTFSTGAGGLAQSPAVCIGGKARGVTGSTNPTGDAYDVDFVAHEIGHQFGGSHSFNAVTGGCSGNRSSTAGTQVEPGSGITIMGYAGLCLATNNLANNSIPYFHAMSQNQIGVYITLSGGSTCGTTTSTGNLVPVVNAGADYTIPASTPFVLSGSATDGNGNALTYSWEEMDAGAFGASWNSGNAPFFRSFAPVPSPVRYFPQLSDITNGVTTIGEILPTTAQTLNFRLTARDNRSGGGGICSDDMTVAVSTASPAFTVTSHSSAASLTANGSNTTTVTWNAGSTTGAPFNTANVSILFSADGGMTWPFTLVSSTPNDGSESIIVPAINTANGRIMVKAVGNIFFNVNSGKLTITSSCAAEGATVAPSANVSTNAGNSALNLGLSPQYSTTFAPSGSITSSDPVITFSAWDGVTCNNYCNLFAYKTYPFVVTATGSYTFNRTGAGSIFTIYSPGFNGNLCNNVVGTNYTVGVGTSASINVNLVAGQTYVLLIGTASSGTCASPVLTLPFNFSFTITPPAGGALYNGTGIYLNSGAGFSYAYVVVNNNTGNIVSIGATSNLTNTSVYPAGSYTVYGLSYSNSISNLNTFVGGSFTALTNQIASNPSGFCANISKNAVTVTISSKALPVSFLTLTARKQENKVVLDWGTASEQNSSHFVVQRAKNGTDFSTEVGKVSGAGNSNTARYYTLNDLRPATGWNYYRVQQVDFDGRFSYSNTAAVNFDDKGSLLVIYPNPARDVLNIEYTGNAAKKIELQVIDSKGAVLISKTMAVVAGSNLESINIASLSKGVYFIRYQDNEGKISFTKFVKQ